MNIIIPFYVILAFFGLSHVSDFGISWDENTSRANGAITATYIVRLIGLGHYFPDTAVLPDLAQWQDADYGVALELPLTAAEFLSGKKQLRDIFIVRHTATFAFCSLGFLALGLLAKRRFNSELIGAFTFLQLVLFPRFFAESFYNSKDLGFAATIAIFLFLLQSVLRKPTRMAGILMAVAAAVSVDTRIAGLMCVVLAAGAVALKSRSAGRRWFVDATVFVTLSCGLIYAFWPWLWEAPVERFLTALHNMSHFRWNGLVLFNGKTAYATDLPRSYIPTWISITTPLPTLMLSVVGFAAFASAIFRAFLGVQTTSLFQRTFLVLEAHYLDLSVASIALAPIAAAIAMHSVLYDG